MLLQSSVSIQGQIIEGLQQITEAIANWVVPLAAIASVAMAFLQTIKNQTPLRNWYQRFRVRLWLRSTLRRDFRESRWKRFRNRVRSRFRAREVRCKEDSQVSDLERELISLATAGDQDAFYDLEIENLCDQIRKIVSILLDYPLSHEKLLRCLARGGDANDVMILLSAARAESKPLAAQSNDIAKHQSRQIAAAKSRVLSQVRCSVDAIQTTIGFRWKFWLQFASMMLSGVLGYIAVKQGMINAKDSQGNLPSFWTPILIGFLAGFLAPITRDLVAAIEQWRK